MNKTINIIKPAALLLVAIFIATGLYAATSFLPDDQPPGYLAGIAISTDDLEYRDATDPSPNPGGGKAYRPWFENGAWQGDIVEYNISAAGSLSTSVSLDTTPPGNTGTNWSARVVLDATLWSTRKIITLNDATDPGTQVDFLWDKISVAQQSAIDDPAVIAGDTSSKILDFIRGDRSNEIPTVGGTLRQRFSALGDILHATPAYVGAPNRLFGFDDYAGFKTANAARAPRVYAAANDGMIHAFDAVTGAEVYAYIPSIHIAKINKLASSPYLHTYFNDGHITAADVQIDGIWKTVLVGSYGAGGKGFFALDITDPNEGKILWELDSGSDADIGYTYSRPAIARFNDGKWYAAVGNGYVSASGAAILMMIDIKTGATIKLPKTTPLPGSVANPNGLSSPILIEGGGNGAVPGDFKADHAYAGDIDGHLWKFDLFDANPANWDVSYAGVALHTGPSTQPILTKPDVSAHPSGGQLVYFGTGRLFTLPELNNTDTQAIVAIWDKNVAPGAQALLAQTLSVDTTHAVSGERIRTITDNPIDWITHTGWKIDLPAGERLLTNPAFRADRLQFISTNPTVDGGINWLMEPHKANGGPPPVVVFDLTGNSVLDDVDKQGTDIPVAWQLGAGIASQPMFAKVATGIDTLFINNLVLPFVSTCTGSCIGGLSGGHMDVDTDSPKGQRWGAWYNITDGIGDNSDGHVHEYDEHHGITSVDVLNIEPRRNLSSLDVRSGNVFIMPQQLNNVDEVLKPDATAAPIAGNKQFIVVLANADLSPGGVLKIGGKEWKVQDYQDMMVDILQNGKPLLDLDGDSLVFTLDAIKASGSGEFKIEFDDQAIIEGGLMPTVWSCPKGFQDPYNYSNNSGHPWLAIPNTLNKHITKVPNGVANDPTPAVSGYRWRNGTLVMQLLDVNNYSLQPWNFMPTDNSGNVTGGVHALAYSTPPSASSGATSAKGTKPGEIESGLLYEVFMYWHYGDLYEDIRVGKKAPCYGVGAAKWSAAVNIERKGLTYGEYQAIIGDLTDASQEIIDFTDATQAVENCLADVSCTEATLNTLLQTLADAINVSSEFKDYIYYRPYAAGGLIPQDKLLSIDQQPGGGASAGGSLDGQPATVTGKPPELANAPGLNFKAGSRTWTDVTPDP